MNFSFGIVTNLDNEEYLLNLINSILIQNIENFEIIIVGPVGQFDPKNKIAITDSFTLIDFDESEKEGWITKKKNLIVKYAKYENIVFLHDYLMLDKTWYSGYLKYGNSFDICLNPIINKDQSRFRDWCLSPHNFKLIDKNLNTNSEFLIPYEEDQLTDYMYISGAYWVSKKFVMIEYPLNENLAWGDGEDIEWSHRVRKTQKFKFNSNSAVFLQKQKDVVFNEITDENLIILKNYESKFLIRYFDNMFAFVRRNKLYLSRQIKYRLKKIINMAIH
jgi:hypothetical protein